MAKGVKSFYLFLICIYNKGDTGKNDNLMKIKTKPKRKKKKITFIINAVFPPFFSNKQHFFV